MKLLLLLVFAKVLVGEWGEGVTAMILSIVLKS